MTKEELKQVVMDAYNQGYHDAEPKFKNRQTGAAGFVANKIMENGAKWQQERMFELVEEYNQMLVDPNVHEDHKEKSFKEWFKQFKKK